MKIDENMTFLDSSTQYLIREKVEYLVRKIPNLKYIVLFGSYARMEQTVKSDIDLLVISSGMPDRLLRGDLCSEFEQKNIDLVFYDLNIFRESDCLFISQIKKEGIILWRQK